MREAGATREGKGVCIKDVEGKDGRLGRGCYRRTLKKGEGKEELCWVVT